MRFLALALLILSGCGGLVGKKIEFVERTEIKESIRLIDQLTATGQAKKMVWTTTATITAVDNFTSKSGKKVSLLQLDNGFWIPQTTDSPSLKIID